MGCGATHQLNEVVILLGRVAVALDIADDLAVDLAGGVEAEGGLYPLVLQVAVDGFGNADNLHVHTLGLVILGQNSCVCVGVVATDDYESLDVEFLKNLQTLVKLLGCLQLRAA